MIPLYIIELCDYDRYDSFPARAVSIKNALSAKKSFDYYRKVTNGSSIMKKDGNGLFFLTCCLKPLGVGYGNNYRSF